MGNRSRQGARARRTWAISGAVVLAVLGLIVALGQWVLPDPLHVGEDGPPPSISSKSSSTQPQTPDVASQVIRNIRDRGPELGALFSTIDKAPPPNAVRAADNPFAFLHSAGGFDLGQTAIEVVIQGRDERAVVITGLDIQVTNRRPPFQGVYVAFAGGEEQEDRHLTVNLDDPLPISRPIGSWSFPLRVSSTKPEVLTIVAETERCNCSWVVVLRYVIGGQPRSTVINDGGRPFHTASMSKLALYDPNYDNNTYVKTGAIP